MESIQAAYRALLRGSLAFLAVTITLCLVRAIMGPRFTDRIVSVNIVCTKSIIMIAILSVLLEQSFLVDIAIVYAMISFLAVVTLSKCYLLPHHSCSLDQDRGDTPSREDEKS